MCCIRWPTPARDRFRELKNTNRRPVDLLRLLQGETRGRRTPSLA
jgi:hypothetical protein